MKKNASCTSELPGQKTGVKATPHFGICIVEESPSSLPAPAEPAPAGATARRAPAGEVMPAAHPPSVVAKVAKLLARQTDTTLWEHSIGHDDGSLHQKVIRSLQAKEPA